MIHIGFDHVVISPVCRAGMARNLKGYLDSYSGHSGFEQLSFIPT
jgi:hypothetical protein